jgi:hypothetical protein
MIPTHLAPILFITTTIIILPLSYSSPSSPPSSSPVAGGGLGLRIMELTGDVNPSMEALNRADILIVTPEVTVPTAAVVGSSFMFCPLFLMTITDYLPIYLSIYPSHNHPL